MNSWEQQMVDLGITGANAFSLPRSVGAIFGLLFASPHPLALDDLTDTLGISRGSASMGLNFLQRMGAIRAVEVPGSRRTTYEPETSFRRLVNGVLQATVVPHLRDSGERLDELEIALTDVDDADRELLRKRLETLRTWRRKGKTIAPFLGKMLGTKAKAQS